MQIDIKKSDSIEYQEFIKKGIRDFNIKSHPEEEIFRIYRQNGYNNPFGFYAFLDNEIIGGIIAYKKMQWLDIDILFVDEKFRSNRIGSQLMDKAVKYCKQEELIGIHLFTLDFQAKGFYEKQGFKLIAQIKDWPKGITRYELIRYIED